MPFVDGLVKIVFVSEFWFVVFMRLFCVAFFFTFAALMPFYARAYSEASFRSWLEGARQDALGMNISAKTIDAAFADVRFLPVVIKLDRKQPEKKSFTEYKKGVLSQARIDEGRRYFEQYKQSLKPLERDTGVPPSIIIALWGIETHYGRITGDFNVFSALATLGYEGRRGDYFKGELLSALQMIERGDVRLSKMRGSWAGAMGNCQFLPSSYLKYAVDGNGDGKRDIWQTRADVFASTANYLQQNKWQAGKPVMERIDLPAQFPDGLIDPKLRKKMSEWQSLGIKSIALKNNVISSYSQASLWQPDGKGGPAYLLYDNHRVLMTWNRSTYFAASVAMLAGLFEKDPAHQNRE